MYSLNSTAFSDVNALDSIIAALNLAERRLVASKGWFKNKIKRELHTNGGLCLLLNRTSLGKSVYYAPVIRILAEYAPLYGGNADSMINCGFWWKKGRIKPRLKVVRHVINYLRIKRQHLMDRRALDIPIY